MTDLKLCKDCRHAIGPATHHGPLSGSIAWDWSCGRSNRLVQPDYVTGAPVEQRYDRCLYVRDDVKRCGPEGKWWEPLT